MEKYTITTLQYGEMKDTYIHQTFDSVLHDLANIAEMPSVQVLGVSVNGKNLSKTKIKTLQSLLRDR